MSKIDPLTDVVATYASVDTLNANFAKIETAIDNTLSRDGSAPNQMDASLDMNHFNIRNVGVPANSSDAARVSDIQTAISNAGITVSWLQGAAGTLSLMEPVLILDTPNSNVNDATYQTLDMSDYVPSDATSVYLQIATYMGTPNIGTGWALRGIGNLISGIDNDGSYRWYPSQSAGQYFTTREWVAITPDGKIEYRRLNPSGNAGNYWKLLLWGFQ